MELALILPRFLIGSGAEQAMGNETIRGLLSQFAEYLTPEEAAGVLGVSVGTVYKKLQTGDLAGFQLGRQWRIPPTELIKLIQRETTDHQRAGKTPAHGPDGRNPSNPSA